ncbi:MAG: carboxypeptidase-like regulatory domain-containing protein [Bacteroidales bacterium]|nr:carboxypeptidase-like regulatory domain-containing protein [Bacteroidales bacterium]
MKKIFLSIIFLALLGFGYAGNEGEKSGVPASAPAATITLTGQVVDFSTGEALTGVEVCLDGTDIKAYTDFDGKFEFGEVKPGHYNIIASYISYNKSLIENYKADSENGDLNIKLQASK